MTQIQVLQEDITRIDVDAVVNAANASLRGGGGVDGAIHAAAGPELLAECATLGGCSPGMAVTTRAYRLPAKMIIHTVGPIWQGGKANEAEVLAKCYESSLEQARQHGAKTVAFPAISCGVYGYPINNASRIAIESVLAFLVHHDVFERIVFCCVNREIEEALRQALCTHSL